MWECKQEKNCVAKWLHCFEISHAQTFHPLSSILYFQRLKNEFILLELLEPSFTSSILYIYIVRVCVINLHSFDYIRRLGF